MSLWDWLVIIGIVVVAVLAGLYFLNRWASKKTVEQNEMIAKSKQTFSIFVIDKKHDLYTRVNLPKTAAEKMPKIYKRLKMHFIMAKIGPQIMTLICDKKIYNFLQPKKNYKADLAGIYISGVKGMKTEAQVKKEASAKKAEEKAAKKTAKSGNSVK